MADSALKVGSQSKRHSWFVGFFIALLKKPLGIAGLLITLLLLFTGIFADGLAPHGMNEPDLEMKVASPSARFWLGADNMGRDVLSRVIYGARISVIVGLSASILATIVSLLAILFCLLSVTFA